MGAPRSSALGAGGGSEAWRRQRISASKRPRSDAQTHGMQVISARSRARRSAKRSRVSARVRLKSMKKRSTKSIFARCSSTSIAGRPAMVSAMMKLIWSSSMRVAGRVTTASRSSAPSRW
jgi:hypothetical protein